MKPFLLLLLLCLVLFASLSDAAETDEFVPVINLDITLDLETSSVKGKAVAVIPELRRLGFSLAGMDVSGVCLDGHDISGSVGQDGMLWIGPLNSSRRLVIEFSKKGDRGDGISSNFISNDRAVLLQSWFPEFQGLAIYNLRAEIPAGLTAVSEADSIQVMEEDGRSIYLFEFSHPREGVTLVAGPYSKTVEEYRGITVETYFFPEDSGLASSYAEKIKYYIDLYSDLLPPYPFRRFAVVENVLPTGFGMPTYTLLGSQVVKLPFITETSLGHEFVHSWFGNSVYVDKEGGNWCEGLTTFLADAFYRELKGEGARWRHETLIEYQARIHGDNAFSVSEFKNGKDRFTRAVGYGKTAMIFHMLQNEVGKRTFRRALRRLVKLYSFRTATWKQIEEVFEYEAQRQLDWFFSQWLHRKDVPEFKFSKVKVEDENHRKKQINFSITQVGQPYVLDIPVRISLPGKDIVKRIHVAEKTTEVSFNVPAKPYGITIDPDFEIMRRLDPGEFPPVLARIFGAEKRFYSVSKEEQEIYGPLVDMLRSYGFVEKRGGEGHGHEEFRQCAIVILGTATGGMKMLAGNDPPPQEGVRVSVSLSPFGPDSVVCVIQASSKDELERVVRKLPHYGKYTTVLFRNGKAVEKASMPGSSGIRLEFQRGITAVAAKDIFPIKKIVRYISSDRVVYVSEQHDLAAHHRAQLEIIKLLYRRGVRLAVGMEMFQRPYQSVLDNYISGRIDEREFLRNSQYFKRWGFDYRLYRPIIEFCRKNGIPVIALNLKKEISKKIARVGIDALDAQERASLPDEIDMSNRQYREHLREVFSQHSKSSLGNFDYFFQAQVGWDETMADSVANYLKEHSHTTMVVIAGVGHIAYGFGIPSRVERRIPGIEYSIIINDPGETLVPEAGDFFLFPPSQEIELSPKLGIGLSDDNGTLLVKSVMPGSPADRGGVKAGDVIVEFDGHHIGDLNDLKTELFFKKLGGRARLKLLRDGDIVEIETGKFTSTSFNFGSPHGSGVHGTAMMKKMHSRKAMKQKEHEIEKREKEEAARKKP